MQDVNWNATTRCIFVVILVVWIEAGGAKYSSAKKKEKVGGGKATAGICGK